MSTREGVITAPQQCRLISNATYYKQPPAELVQRMTADQRRHCLYEIKSRDGDYELHVTLTGNGCMTAKVSTASPQIESGTYYSCSKSEDIVWHDSLLPVVLKSELSREQIAAGLTPQEIMTAFLAAANVERHAATVGGYACWMQVMQIYTERLAARTRSIIQLQAELPMTIAPEYRQRSRYQAYQSKGREDHGIIDIDIEQLHQIDDAMQPSAASLRLLGPIMIRQPYIETFTAEPNTRG